MTAPELYFHAKKALEKNGIEEPQFEAMCIAEYIFGQKLQRILIDRSTASPEQINVCDKIIFRRSQGQPLQYLLGRWEFYGLPFCVGRGVLIPRQDTETLIDTALELPLPKAPKILDLCSGTGCIGITLQKKLPYADVSAVEISETAIGYINKNSRLNDVSIRLVPGDALRASTVGKFSELDLIVCNPPYLTSRDMETLQREVRFEPELALYGGEDGLKFYRELIPLWKKALKRGGFLMFEAGIYQAESIRRLFNENNYYDIETVTDPSGIERVVCGRNGG